MLARLDQELAPLRSAVDREGTLLRVGGPAEVSGARVTDIVEQMGYTASPARERPPVARWFGTAEVDELSQEEAGVLADRWVEELEAEAVIPDAQRLREPLRATLLDAFREASRTGAVDALAIDHAAMREAVGEVAAKEVRRWLGRRLGLADHE